MTQGDSLSTSLMRAGTALIEYPRFKELHREILQCQQISKLLGEPQCMSLEGITGAGKTTLVRTYADSFERIVTEAGVTIPVFYVEVPSPVTIRDLAQEALRQLGDPAYDKGTRAALTIRLVELIKACGVELVILDDFQHLIDSETNHILAEVSDWLKVLIKKTNVPFLVVGIEGRVEIILKANPQLSRLFPAREKLEPFGWDWSQEETIQDFSRFVNYVEQAIEQHLTGDLPRLELLYRLHYATNGVVGNLMNLMLNTAFLASKRGQSSLELGLLSLAFRKRLAEHLQGKVDPFAETVGAHFVPPAPVERPAPPGQGVNSGKKRSSAVAAVLTTR
jgi:hypothetical protein